MNFPLEWFIILVYKQGGTMNMYQVGPFKNAEGFAENFIKMLQFNTAVIELMDWMTDVQAGLNDPDLPESVKAQVVMDWKEIQQQFSEFSGSMPSA